MELALFTMTALTVIAFQASNYEVNAQLICLASCDQDANSLAITDNAGQCCSSGGGGYTPLLVGSSNADCQDCLDFRSIQPQIVTDVTPSPIVINQNSQFTCTVSAPGIDVDATIQWLGPDGTVLAEDGPNSETLDLDFEPFQQSDLGDYTCTAQVSSPELPPGIMTFVSRTVSLQPPPGSPASVGESQPPFAGNPYTLTCTLNEEGQTIEWVGPNGNVITSGDGITVGETVSGGGVTTSTLTFSNLQQSDTGRYSCRNPIQNVTRCVITNFPVPDVSITQPPPPRVIGAPYQPDCTGSLPSPLEGSSLTVSWIGPDGSTLASQQTTCQSETVGLPITSLDQSDVGTYTCQTIVSSPFLERSIMAMESFTLDPSDLTRPTVTEPTESQTTQETTSEPSTTVAVTIMTGSPTTPIDECSLGIDNCSKQQKCIFIANDEGFTKTCSPIASCVNTDEGFECRCNEGFEGNGITCKDINECKRDNSKNCHPEAKCINRYGSFKCRCRRGLIGDGVECCIRRMDIKKFLDSEESSTTDKSTSHSKSNRRSKHTRSTKSSHSHTSTSHGSSSHSKSNSRSKSTKSTKSSHSRRSTKTTSSGSGRKIIGDECKAVVDAYISSEKSRTSKSSSKSSKSSSDSTKSSKNTGTS